MTAVRVLRLIEYTYDSQERAEQDMARWAIPATGSLQVSEGKVIRSAVLPQSIIPSDPAVPSAATKYVRPQRKDEKPHQFKPSHGDTCGYYGCRKLADDPIHRPEWFEATEATPGWPPQDGGY